MKKKILIIITTFTILAIVLGSAIILFKNNISTDISAKETTTEVQKISTEEAKKIIEDTYKGYRFTLEEENDEYYVFNIYKDEILQSNKICISIDGKEIVFMQIESEVLKP